MQTIHVNDFFHVPESPELEGEDLRQCLKNRAARRVFRRLLAAGNVMGVSYGVDGRSTEYLEGVRALALWLATGIEAAAPGAMARLMLESMEDRLAARAGITNKEEED